MPIIRWVKSLHCKSKAFDDVYHQHSKVVLPSYSCRKSVKDVVNNTPPGPVNKNLFRSSSCRPELEPTPFNPTRRSVSLRSSEPPPVLTDIPEGHPSRNVVEIIFHSTWSSEYEFPGRVEMIFKVENGSKSLTRFEEYREAVKSRLDSGDVRCTADGNEMMRFYPIPLGFHVGAWGLLGSQGTNICTYGGSGEVYVGGGGGGGRRGMLVCRVIVGRVGKRGDVGSDSVAGRGGGELLVFDARAVLPCFLIVFRL